MSSFYCSVLYQFLREHQLPLLSLTTSVLLLAANLQRYNHVQHEYDHYQRRYKMLHAITRQKRDELEHLMNSIRQLVLFEDSITVDCRYRSSVHRTHAVCLGAGEDGSDDESLARLCRSIESTLCVYDRGDRLSMPSAMISLEGSTSMFADDDGEDDGDEETSENDPLLQRLKLTRPSRLKNASRSKFQRCRTLMDDVDPASDSADAMTITDTRTIYRSE